MIGVGRIIIGRQYGCEKPASAVADLAQESALRPVGLPVAKHADVRAIGEPKANDVDRVGGRMFAVLPLGPAIEAAAGVAPRMLDGGKFGGEMARRRRLQRLAFE